MSYPRLRRLLPLACAALALATGLVRADEAPIPLHLTLLPHSHQLHDARIKVVMDMQLKPGAGASDEETRQLSARMGTLKMPITLTMQMQQRLQTGPADAQGRIPLTARIEHSVQEARTGDGELMQNRSGTDMPQMQFSADIVDGRYENVRLSGESSGQLPPDLVEGLFRKTFDTLAALNGTSLRVGDSVELPVVTNLPIAGLPGGSKEGRWTARYTLSKVQAGVAFFDVDAKMDYRADVPAASAPDGAAPRQMAMSGSGSGHLQVRLADRLPMHHDFDMQLYMQMPLPQGHEMQTKMQIQMTSDGQSLPASAATAEAASPPAVGR